MSKKAHIIVKGLKKCYYNNEKIYIGDIMKYMTKKTKFRVTMLTIVFISTIVLSFSSLFTNVSQIIKNKKDMETLKISYNEKLEEEENLKNEINKLQDPEYMARYTREKYFYSADNEIIIKIEE